MIYMYEYRLNVLTPDMSRMFEHYSEIKMQNATFCAAFQDIAHYLSQECCGSCVRFFNILWIFAANVQLSEMEKQQGHWKSLEIFFYSVQFSKRQLQLFG